MNLSPLSETIGQDNQTWLGSAHGTSAAESMTLDITTFTAGTHYPTGWLPSGTPLGKITASGKYGIYDNTTPATDGRQTLVGFLLIPVRVIWYPSGTAVADAHGALLTHGRVIQANLPFAIDSAGITALGGRFRVV